MFSGSGRCECGPQLDKAIQDISNDSQGGFVIYMAGHEGRGIGLWAKAATYILQDEEKILTKQIDLLDLMRIPEIFQI